MLPYATMVSDALSATLHLNDGDRKKVLDLTGREVYSAAR
jgi:hypothetical protein